MINSTCLHMLGHKHASPTLFASFELLHLHSCNLHLQCVKERGPADASDKWMQIRATIEGMSPELLHLMRSADEATQVEPISYQAADMWAVGLLLVLMLTGGMPFLSPDVAGKTYLSFADEAARKACVAKHHEVWVCVWIVLHCAAGCNILHIDA
jgi:serine/threonine protein kinase